MIQKLFKPTFKMYKNLVFLRSYSANNLRLKKMSTNASFFRLETENLPSFKFKLKSEQLKKKKHYQLFLVKKDRGVVASHYKFNQSVDTLVGEDKEILVNDRSYFLMPSTKYSVIIHNGLEFRAMPKNSFRSPSYRKAGADFFLNYSRRENIKRYYPDDIFSLNKIKLGAFIITKKIGQAIHYLKKK